MNTADRATQVADRPDRVAASVRPVAAAAAPLRRCRGTRKPKRSSKASYDQAAAARLWQASAELVGLTAAG